MRKRSFAFILTLAAVCLSQAWAQEESFLTSPSTDSLGSTFTYAHEEIVSPKVHVTQDDLTRQAIRERVQALRRDRQQSMPYLAKADIREAIDAKRVKERIQFVSGEQKKLQDLLERAVEAHMPARAAHERISLAQRRIFMAVRELFPEMSFEYEDEEGTLSSGVYNSRGYHFTLRQPVFRGGILWNTMLQERAELKASRKEYDKIIEDLVKDVAEAYFEYNRASQAARDQIDALERMKRFAVISEEKFKEELISEIEHLNVQSLYNQMKYDYETAKQELELAQLELQSYLDLGSRDDVEIAGLYNMDELLEQGRQEADETPSLESDEGHFAPAAETPPLDDLVNLAYKNRAELQVEAARLEAARLRERTRWGELLPHADVVVEAGALGEALDFNSTHPKRRNEWRVLLEFKWNMMGNTVNYNYENDQNAPSVTEFQSSSEGNETIRNTISVNLLDGLEALAEVKEAEAEKLEQIVELENAEKQVVQDVKEAYFEYQKALIQVRSSLQRLDYRDRLAQLSKHRLEQNEIQVSEYVQAEIDLLREKTELHKALKDYFTAKAALNRAVGIRNYLPIEEFYGRA